MKDKIQRLFLLILTRFIPVDIFSRRYPISIKGIIIHDNKVLLLRNERNEWDLPGGKMRNDNSSEACLMREVKEETNLEVQISKIVGTTIYDVQSLIEVFIVIYKCELISSVIDFKISGEHFGGQFFTFEEIDDLSMLEIYKIKIKELLR